MISIKIDYDTGRRKGIIKSDFLDNIREYFSIDDPQSRFRKKYYVGYQAPTRLYSITPQGRFEPRMYNEIINYVKGLETPYTLTISDAFKKIVEPEKLSSSVIYKLKNLDSLNIELRDYQEESVLKGMECGYGVIVLPTSAGKTLVMATLIESIYQQRKGIKTLVVVPGIQLLQQTYKDFLEYGIDEKDITCWEGGDSPKTRIVIANTEILCSELQDVSWFYSIDLLICDEVHKIKRGNKITKVISKIPVKMSFGLTGTLPENKIDVWCINGIFGSIIYTKTSKELRDNKQISNVIVSSIKVYYKSSHKFKYPSAINPTEAYEEEIEFLQNNSYRNNLITKLVNKVDKNVLVMVDRIVHGEILLKILSENLDKKVYFIRGDVELEDREAIIRLMEKENNIVCIAISKIFSTGINIKNLHYVIFAAIGKGKIKTIQTIGRTLRLHSSKCMAYIFDIADMLRYGQDHYEKRMEFYKDEIIPLKEITVREN